MISRKLKITSINDEQFITNKVVNYSNAFRLLWKMLDESSDNVFIERFKERFKLSDIEYRSILAMAKARWNAFDESNKKKQDKIAELEKALSSDNDLPKRKKYKIFNKIAFLKRSLNSNIVFGGKSLLQELTRECNKDERNASKIEQLRSEWKNRRLMPFFITGEGNQKGNRFFDFKNIQNGKLVYKPTKGVKIEITFKLPKKYYNDFVKLSEFSESKEISISIALSNEYVIFTYDEEKLNGYAIDIVSRNKDVREIKQMGLIKEHQTERIKEVYRRYYDKQHNVKLQGKIENRCIALDLNPTNIGYSILDKTEDGCKIIKCGLFDMSKLFIKTGLSSNSEKQKRLNGKRKYELTVVLKKLFNLARHYKCSMFVIEDLENVQQQEEQNKETNRKVKNLWNKGLILNIIRRRCNENGIELVEVNPCYSSFIGNIKYKYIDATNASIEIGRRGLHKYTKGMFYPVIEDEDIRTLESKFGRDVEYGTCSSWLELYKTLVESFDTDKKRFNRQLRSALGDVSNRHWKRTSVDSRDSKIYCINFY